MLMQLLWLTAVLAIFFTGGVAMGIYNRPGSAWSLAIAIVTAMVGVGVRINSPLPKLSLLNEVLALLLVTVFVSVPATFVGEKLRRPVSSTRLDE